MSGSNEDRRQRSQCSNDRQSEELVVALQVVLGESSKIREVDGHGGEEADDGIQACQSRVCRVHVRGCDFGIASDERAAPVGDDRSPQEESEEGWRYYDTLDQEENPELLDRHAGEDGLEDPVDELEADQSSIRAWTKGVLLQSKEDWLM